MVHIIEMQLEALIAQLNEDYEKADRKMKEAVALDESLSYSYGPPIILKPIHEGYGEFLASHGRNGEALQVFKASIKRSPRRLISLNGLKSVATMLKDQEALAIASKELETSLAKQDREEIL